MCLYVNKEASAKLFQKFKNREYIICYKVVNAENGIITSSIYDYCWKKGFNKSKSTVPPYYKHQMKNKYLKKRSRYYNCDGRINVGIHVYTRRPDDSEDRIMAIKCYKEDFIAADNSYEAVFKQVELTPRQYNKLLKNAPENPPPF
jgi:hypothetical protein